LNIKHWINLKYKQTLRYNERFGPFWVFVEGLEKSCFFFWRFNFANFWVKITQIFKYNHGIMSQTQYNHPNTSPLSSNNQIHFDASVTYYECLIIKRTFWKRSMNEGWKAEYWNGKTTIITLLIGTNIVSTAQIILFNDLDGIHIIPIPYIWPQFSFV
jgi:hypothetical protein